MQGSDPVAWDAQGEAFKLGAWLWDLALRPHSFVRELLMELPFCALSAEGAVRDSTATPELKLPEETQTRESQTKTKNEDHDRGGEENNDWPFESGACVLSPPQTEAP